VKTLLVALVSGLLFGLGLIVSGMANPARVLGFLDLFGAWDPSLAFVMAGAVGVGVFAFGFARRRQRALLGAEMRLPSARRIDARLVAGALVFGVGWGIAGFCPGPSLVALAAGAGQALVFVASMLAGMALVEWFERGRRSSADDEGGRRTIGA
jgi:uncharacterized membrane protein YedE/YeeE